MRSKVLSVVRSKLRAHGVSIDVADLESCYAQAWQGLYAALLEGEEIDDAPAWLVTVTFRRAIDESRVLARHQLADAEGQAAVGFDPDIDGVLDARARLSHVFEGLRSRLNERECELASLCYVQGLSRAQAAERLGVSEARVRKLMDGASPSRPGVAGKVNELLAAISAERWCEEQSSLMKAFAFGLLDREGERYALAVAHTRECPACRAHVASLRGLAAVLPPLPLPFALTAGTGAGLGAAAYAGRASPVAPSAFGRLAGSLGSSVALKPAVCGLIVLAGAYVVATGGPAHGSPPASPRAVSLLEAPTTARSATLLEAPAPRRASASLRYSAGRSPITRRHVARHAPLARSKGSATPAGLAWSAAREFGPERLASAPASAGNGSSSARRRRSSAASEFGFE